MVVLNSSWNTNYKSFARKSKFRECYIAEEPINTIIIDVRSRLFRYIRLNVKNRSLNDKIKCTFGLFTSIRKEISNVLDYALNEMRKEANMLLVNKHIYVFPSSKTCPFKDKYNKSMYDIASQKYEDLKDSIRSFKRDMFDIDKLIKCHNAFESYLISNISQICLHYSNPDVLPDDSFYFESDLLCAHMNKNEEHSSAVLSEDLDCVALFGANMMIKEVYPKFFTYITISEIMEVFKSTNRKNLVYKCCILGTDYNYGIKGIGPVKITKIDDKKLFSTFETCLELQSINKRDIENFFSI